MQYLRISRNIILMILSLLFLAGCTIFSTTGYGVNFDEDLPSSTFTHSTVTNFPITVTPSVAPTTLDSSQVRDRLTGLLLEASDCDAPCFWTITPGQTTYKQVKEVLAEYGLPSSSTIIEGRVIEGVKYDFGNGLLFKLLLTIDKNVVQNSRIEIIPELQSNDPRQWLAFSPDTIINRYGAPSRIEMAVDFGGSRSLFDLILYYDQNSMIIEYMSYSIQTLRSMHPEICPLSDQFDSVRVWMGDSPQNLPIPGLSIEEAASITINDFSEIVGGERDNSCFEINPEKFR